MTGYLAKFNVRLDDRLFKYIQPSLNIRPQYPDKNTQKRAGHGRQGHTGSYMSAREPRDPVEEYGLEANMRSRRNLRRDQFLRGDF